MKPWYAGNARFLLASREHGMRPDGAVVVSLIGGRHDDLAATTLYVDTDMPADRLDWRMLADLEVWLWAGPEAALSWLLQTALRIAHARPKRLVLRFEEEGDVFHDLEVGAGVHTAAVKDIAAIHAFVWTPINTACTATGAKLRRALDATLPYGTIL